MKSKHDKFKDEMEILSRDIWRLLDGKNTAVAMKVMQVIITELIANRGIQLSKSERERFIKDSYVMVKMLVNMAKESIEEMTKDE